jgi:hypothetical protein
MARPQAQTSRAAERSAKVPARRALRGGGSLPKAKLVKLVLDSNLSRRKTLARNLVRRERAGINSRLESRR